MLPHEILPRFVMAFLSKALFEETPEARAGKLSRFIVHLTCRAWCTCRLGSCLRRALSGVAKILGGFAEYVGYFAFPSATAAAARGKQSPNAVTIGTSAFRPGLPDAGTV